MLVCASQIIKLSLEQCRAIFLSPSNYIYCQHPHDAAGAGEHDAADGAVRQQPREPRHGAHRGLLLREEENRGSALRTAAQVSSRGRGKYFTKLYNFEIFKTFLQSPI